LSAQFNLPLYELTLDTLYVKDVFPDVRLAQEFMRRFLLHVLPGGFHRTRHYGQLANGIMSRSTAAALMPTSRARPSAGVACACMLPRPSTAHTAPAGPGINTGLSANASAAQPVACHSPCMTGHLVNVESP